MEKKMKLAYINNQFCEWDSAKIHVSSLAFTLGASVFEACRVNWNSEEKSYCIFRIKDHVDRLFNSIKIMRYNIKYSKEEVLNILYDLVKKWDGECNGYIRITVYVPEPSPGSSVYDPNLVNADLCITLVPSSWPDTLKTGIKCCVSSWERINDNCLPPRVKSACNYENTRLAGHEAILNGYDNAILLNRIGKVSEAAESAVFIIDNNDNLITPDCNSDILPSITRDTIIYIWKKLTGKSCIQRTVDRTELYIAKEMFICNTAKLIRPVLSVDQLPIGDSKPGSKTLEIEDIFLNTIIGKEEYFKKKSIIIYGGNLNG